ncbi:hypothetical protein SJZ84_01430 [Hafnia paralvei]|uniref:hypothetical protein n=1 Tax=Hafnia paralvei TaxID=546367 RepID=UPI0026DCAFD4|nr:hypothetical protein [Hafnia paralvei]MDX6909492.1 hypothetical protein [Hafnia paralvei]
MTNFHNTTTATTATYSVFDSRLTMAELFNTRLCELERELSCTTNVDYAMRLLAEYFYVLELYQDLVDEAQGYSSLSTPYDMNW